MATKAQHLEYVDNGWALGSDGVRLLAIVGTTASGKTGLAIEIAKKYNGEIIAADSRTVYKGLDIGTAKPSKAEQQGIKHWGFDLVGPGESFNVADYKKYADDIIKDIISRGKMPILVGGSGLYVDAVLYNFSLAPQNQAVREQLDGLGIIELRQMINDKGFDMPANDQNKRHLIRVLERGGTEIAKKQLASGTVVIGLNPPKDVLKQRITERAQLMLTSGIMDEVRWALENYPIDSEALTGGVYRIFRDVIWGDLTQQAAIEKFVFSDMHLAKRQVTWFKRNPDIKWFESTDLALEWFNKKFNGAPKD